MTVGLTDELRDYLGQLVNEAVAHTIERAPLPTTQSGTVQSVDGSGLAQVIIDGDLSASSVMNVSGASLAVGLRVQVLFMPPHAAMIIGPIATGIVPVGVMFVTRNSTLDDGFLWCNGTAIPTQHTALIAICGANTPDLRGRTLVGLDNMGGAADAGRLSVANTLGLGFGSNDVKAHTHTWSEGGFNGVLATNVNPPAGAIGYYRRNPTGNPIQSAGTGSDNCQPSMLANVIIKY